MSQPRAMARNLLFLSLFVLLLLSASAHSGHDDNDDDDGDDVDSHDLRSRPLILAKIWCLIIIFLATFVAGVSPYFLKWNEGFLTLGTQFAGGVFLGTALMHFLSDANETFEDLTNKEYPFAFMLACAGYLLTMAADCVIGYVYGKENGGGSGGADLELQGGAEQGKSFSNDATSQSQNQVHHGAKTHFPNPTVAAVAPGSLGDNILLIVALCFHSVFEGIAIGVAETKADAWKALWTISLHKIFAAIAMGIALLRMIPNRPLLSCAAYAFAFAISSPVGVAIGIIMMPQLRVLWQTGSSPYPWV
ncbi:Zinc transporter 11 [Morella rubra]|uniref:Zinc transporter 11 n=1 Tax=Morella rubra TaxID=262757 RepID=A0A6A1UTW3_9ROSI|nr:Zinc transporter 11 [Morella rubra]